MSAALEIVGGGYPGLLRAVEEVRRGGRVELVEPALRIGGALVTESFLSPFRFNLGPALVRRPPIPALHVLEPEELLTVGSATLGRGAVALIAAGEVRSTLDASGIADPEQRALLTAFAVLAGIDPEAPASGAALAEACADLPELVLVSGGNGLAVACLVDEIVASGSRVVEGVGGASASAPAETGLGLCRMFVGLRGRAPAGPAVAVGVGFDGEDALYARLRALRAGATEPVGFVVANGHLDANHLDDRLESFVWQGVLPFAGGVSRASYSRAVLDAVGVDPADVVFQLLWLPEDTGEPLR